MILTNKGLELENSATISGISPILSEFGVSSDIVTLTADSVTLTNEIARYPVDNIERVAGVLRLVLTVPQEVAPFTLNSLVVYDNNGNIYGVQNYQGVEKITGQPLVIYLNIAEISTTATLTYATVEGSTDQAVLQDLIGASDDYRAYCLGLYLEYNKNTTVLTSVTANGINYDDYAASHGRFLTIGQNGRGSTASQRINNDITPTGGEEETTGGYTHRHKCIDDQIQGVVKLKLGRVK